MRTVVGLVLLRKDLPRYRFQLLAQLPRGRKDRAQLAALVIAKRGLKIVSENRDRTPATRRQPRLLILQNEVRQRGVS